MRQALTAAVLLSLGMGMAVPAESQVMVGAKGGVTVPKIAIKSDGVEAVTNSHTGILAGGVFALGVGPWLTLQLEGRYSQQGTTQPQGDDIDAILRLSYAQAPITAQFIIPTAGIIRPRIFAGGYYAREVACSLVAEGMGVRLDIGCEDTEPRKKSDYGAIFGAGSDVVVGPGAITLDAEYAMGLRNLASSPEDSAYHRVFSFAAGYKLFL